MTNYLERIGQVLAPSGHYSQETERRFLTGMKEMMVNGCLTCRHNTYCTLPYHGMPAEYDRQCAVYSMGDYGEVLTSIFQRHFPEHDWKMIFSGLDWTAYEHIFISAAIGVCTEGCNESC